jgi:hypothetical protein
MVSHIRHNRRYRNWRPPAEILDLKQFGTVTSVFALDVEGNATQYEILRWRSSKCMAGETS